MRYIKIQYVLNVHFGELMRKLKNENQEQRVEKWRHITTTIKDDRATVLRKHRGMASKILNRETNAYIEKIARYRKMRELAIAAGGSISDIVDLMRMMISKAATSKDGMISPGDFRTIWVRVDDGLMTPIYVQENLLEATKLMLIDVGLMDRGRGDWRTKNGQREELWRIDVQKVINYYCNGVLNPSDMMKELNDDLLESENTPNDNR
jgi:hypothetical protein